MSLPSYVQLARDLGYSVVETSEIPIAKDGTDSEGMLIVWKITGFGVELLATENDQDLWGSILDVDSDAERKQQDSETPQETQERLGIVEDLPSRSLEERISALEQKIDQ